MTTAFFQFARRPKLAVRSRFFLPVKLAVLTLTTVFLKSSSTARLISILLAFGLTRKTYWLFFSESRGCLLSENYGLDLVERGFHQASLSESVASASLVTMTLSKARSCSVLTSAARASSVSRTLRAPNRSFRQADPDD